MATQLPTEEEVLGWMTSLSNWDRWGPDDELGTLNLITPEKRVQAGRLVREGIRYHLNNPGLKAHALIGCHNGGTLA